jgi:double-stranded uracil-DNA glycosylase
MNDAQQTLPDYLEAGLALVFVGINPGLYSAQVGHYFARKTNRFWPSFSRSRLSAAAREGLGKEGLGPEDDGALLSFGIGFTDVVKRPTNNAAQLSPVDYREGAPELLSKLERFQPVVACFHGVTGFSAFARLALRDDRRQWALGPQDYSVGRTRIFVVPSPSPANAHYTASDQIEWYDTLADYLKNLDPQALPPRT